MVALSLRCDKGNDTNISILKSSFMYRFLRHRKKRSEEKGTWTRRHWQDTRGRKFNSVGFLQSMPVLSSRRVGYPDAFFGFGSKVCFFEIAKTPYMNTCGSGFLQHLHGLMQILFVRLEGVSGSYQIGGLGCDNSGRLFCLFRLKKKKRLLRKKRARPTAPLYLGVIAQFPKGLLKFKRRHQWNDQGEKRRNLPVTVLVPLVVKAWSLCLRIQTTYHTSQNMLRVIRYLIPTCRIWIRVGLRLGNGLGLSIHRQN